MIDVKKTRNNFQKFPSLKQMCDPGIVVKPQATIKTATKTATATTTATATAATLKNSQSNKIKTESLTTTTQTTTNIEALKYCLNKAKNKTNNRELAEHQQSSSKGNNTTNPVREANLHFFLVPEFQDKNFLKAECELAHAQVSKVPTTATSATEKNSNKTILPAINDKRLSHVNIRNTISSSNNNSVSIYSK